MAPHLQHTHWNIPSPRCIGEKEGTYHLAPCCTVGYFDVIRRRFARRVERINDTKLNDPQRPNPSRRLPKEGHHEHTSNVQQHFGRFKGNAVTIQSILSLDNTSESWREFWGSSLGHHFLPSIQLIAIQLKGNQVIPQKLSLDRPRCT